MTEKYRDKRKKFETIEEQGLSNQNGQRIEKKSLIRRTTESKYLDS